jgi:hypothetical protein
VTRTTSRSNSSSSHVIKWQRSKRCQRLGASSNNQQTVPMGLQACRILALYLFTHMPPHAHVAFATSGSQDAAHRICDLAGM